LGNLFNKDALVQALLNKTLPPSLSYITGVVRIIDGKLYGCALAAGGLVGLFVVLFVLIWPELEVKLSPGS